MKVSRSSWHYRLCNKVFNYPSRSLCIYFWQIPIAAVICAVVGTIVSAVVIGMTSAFLFMLAQPVFINSVPMALDLMLVLGALSLVVWCAVFDTLNKHFANKSWNVTLIKKRIKDKPKVKKESLLLAYLKAKKDKVCPTIEFDWS